jgi:hypothetical protein
MDTFYEGLHVFLGVGVTMRSREGISSQETGSLPMQRSLPPTSLWMSLVPFANVNF